MASSRKRQATLVAVIFLALFALQLQLPRWCYMGDEARYLHYAASFHRDGTFSMPRAEWAAVLARIGCPYVDAGGLRQTVGYAMLLAPIAGRFDLEGARWLNFCVSLLGFAGVYALLRRYYGVALSAAAMVIAAFTLPAFGYHKSIFPEVPMMTLAVWAWYFIEGGCASLGRALLIVALLVALPLAHIRAIPLAITLFAVMLWTLWRNDRRRVAPMVVFGLVGAAVFVLLSRHLYGAVTGSAWAAHKFALGDIIPLVMLHLLDLRHGLLVYAPVWVFALAGFILGCWRRERAMMVSAVLLAVYALSLIWSIAAESMPARYWVAALPMLTMGLVGFFAERKRWLAWSAFVPLALISAANTVWFLMHSGTFLENRTMSLSYHTLFQRFPYFHLGAFLPWDGIDYGAPHMEQSFPRAAWLSVAALAVVALTVCACRSRKRMFAIASSLAALAMVLGVVGASGVAAIATEDYRVLRSTDPRLIYDATASRVKKVESEATANPAWMTILFLVPSRPDLVVLPRTGDLWYAPNYPVEFRLEASEDGTRFTPLAEVTARGVLSIPIQRRIVALRIMENPRTAQSRWLGPGAPRVYRRDPHLAILALLAGLSIGVACLAVQSGVMLNRRMAAVFLLVMIPTPSVLAQGPESTASLLLRFDNEHDLARKERLLLTVTSQDTGAGPALLRLAQSTTNTDTRWMAMRGMSALRYAGGAPFLKKSLKDSDALVRANAARALGDLRIRSASAPLLAMFAAEQEPPAVQQASLALRMLEVKAAAPHIRRKILVFAGQTRAWLIQALGAVGNIADVPMIAGYLDDMTADWAATEAIQELTGVNFGPRRTGLTGWPPPETLAAQVWWKSHKAEWSRYDDCHPE